MKKILGLILALASIGVVGAASEATAAELSAQSAKATATASAQWYRDRYGRRVYNRRRNVRTVTRSRVVRYGRRLYRETFVVRYLPSGRVNTRLISRVRIS